MRGKRRMMLLGPALLVALALPPIAATGASAAAGTAQVATVQAQAGTSAVAASYHSWCGPWGHQRCCGHWGCGKHFRRHHHHGFGHHGNFRHFREFDRFDNYGYHHSYSRFDHGRW